MMPGVDEWRWPGEMKVSPTNVRAVRQTTRRLTAVDYDRGGHAAKEVAQKVLDTSRVLLSWDCPPRLQPELQSAVGDMAHAAGFVAFDAGDHNQAREDWRFALNCADQASDMSLWAQALASEARQEIWLLRPDAGEKLIEGALAHTRQLSHTELAKLWGVRARGRAVAGDVKATLAAIDVSQQHLEKATPDADPHAGSYTPAIHAGNVAHSLCDLVAMHDHHELAQSAAIYESIALQDDAPARHRAFVWTLAATTTMAAGDPHEAALIGNDALDAAAGVRSARLSRMHWDLHRTAHQHGAIPEVDFLRRRIQAAA